MMKLASLAFLAFAALTAAEDPGGEVNSTNTNSTETPVSDLLYDDCEATDYYAELEAQGSNDTWTREQVRTLITETHRNVLPNVNSVQGEDDILMALIDLDPGDEPGETVRLLYRDMSYPATPAGNPNTWRRADLWTTGRGARRSSPALTDVHSKRPADSTVLLKKKDLFYGLCGTVETDNSCSRPATTETASDTEQDDKVFAPPVGSRGDVARALFYTGLRYEQALGLKLTDCPPFGDGEFGYLSQLLQWHIDDPVSEEEKARNARACGRWQGNRNPFVDYPELVERFFGQPDVVMDGTYMYSLCTTPTDAPTASPNECSALIPGDIPVFVLNSDRPDQVVFYPLADIPESVGSLYVTDNAWTGTGFANNEGTVEFVIPEGGIKAGRSFGYGKGSPYADSWIEQEENFFELGINGDQVFIYCLDADDKPNILWGFSYAGDWAESGLPDYGTNSSALPDTLKDVGNVALAHQDNCLYVGAQAGKKSELLESFLNAENYQCADLTRYEVDLSSSSWRACPTTTLAVALFVVYLPFLI